MKNSYMKVWLKKSKLPKRIAMAKVKSKKYIKQFIPFSFGEQHSI